MASWRQDVKFKNLNKVCMSAVMFNSGSLIKSHTPCKILKIGDAWDKVNTELFVTTLQPFASCKIALKATIKITLVVSI